MQIQRRRGTLRRKMGEGRKGVRSDRTGETGGTEGRRRRFLNPDSPEV